jgi:hypothetical protein
MFWNKFRGIFMLGLGGITSPCCTPFVVPLGLSLLGGTPLAAWLALRIGWSYGGLTLVSLLSFVLAVRWMRSPTRRLSTKPLERTTPPHVEERVEPLEPLSGGSGD